MWFWVRRRTPQATGLLRALYAICWAMAAQGLVGMVQYETKLPTELVGVHVALSALIWLASLWVVAEAGTLAPRGEPALAANPTTAP
jgi:heme A synthase